MNHDFLTKTELLIVTARRDLTKWPPTAEAFTRIVAKTVRRLGEDVAELVRHRPEESIDRVDGGAIWIRHPAEASIRLRPFGTNNDFTLDIWIGERAILSDVRMTFPEDICVFLEEILDPEGEALIEGGDPE